MKRLQQNTRKQLCDIGVGQDIVFKKTSKAQVRKPNKDIWDSIHHSSLHNQGNDRTKRQSTGWGRWFFKKSSWKEKGWLSFCLISDFSQWFKDHITWAWGREEDLGGRRCGWRGCSPHSSQEVVRGGRMAWDKTHPSKVHPYWPISSN